MVSFQAWLNEKTTKSKKKEQLHFVYFDDLSLVENFKKLARFKALVLFFNLSASAVF